MDTPDRDQIGTPISKFEDSPVFKYINNLSPIKPVKSIHIAQAFSSFSFTSPPSVFTSPHASSHKEFRFLRRHHNFSELSKPDFSSPNGKEGSTSVGGLDAIQMSDCSADPQESSTREVSVDPTTEHPRLAIELPQTLRYDSGSPENNLIPSHDDIKTDPVPEIAGTSVSLVHFVQQASEEGCHPFESEVDLQGVCQYEENKEGKACEWENLIADAAELLIFDSSIDAESSKRQDQKSLDFEPSSFVSVVLELPQDDDADLQKAQPVDQAGSCEQHEMENPATQPGEIGELEETDRSPSILSRSSLNEQTGCNPSDKLDGNAENHIPFSCKADSQQQRGMLRRCLVFEMAGAHRKKLENDCSSSSLISSPSDGNIASDDKRIVPIKPGNGPSPCMLPGIGLHLNALATNSKDCRVVKHEVLASGRQLISMPSSISSFRCPASVQKPLKKMNSMERENDPTDSGVKVIHEASQASPLEVNEEFNQSSPKKKRRKLEHAGERDSCKRCNCKKSKCLKLYCECFAAGVYCVEPCSCHDCFNKPIHEDTVLATRKQIESRNPLAFAPKVIRSSDSVLEIGDDSNKTPASARHKRGCNCKKSSCLKKYCECFQGGVGCSINCRCEGCKNTFGRKDGSASIGTEEVEPEDEETENCEKTTVDKKSFQSNEDPNDEQQYPDSVLPITPSFQIFRPLVQLPFSSSSKPPRSSLLTVGSSHSLHTGHRFKKPDFSHPQPKFEKHFKLIPEEETPEILRGNCSPSVVKSSSSPNSKRVSPPHSEFGSSPGRRSGRKLILQSIPSFPSASHNESKDYLGKYK